MRRKGMTATRTTEAQLALFSPVAMHFLLTRPADRQSQAPTSAVLSLS